MNKGMNLGELVGEIRRQENARLDLIGARGGMHFESATGPTPEQAAKLTFQGRELGFTATGHDQLASLIGIPRSFYHKMRETHPDLHADTVNRLIQDAPESRRMVRTLDGQARAFLSDSYLRVAHGELLESVLPELEGMGMVIESAHIDHERMFVKAFSPRLEAEVKKGDVVRAGLVITNSEVGKGPIRVLPAVYRLVCTNGMISAQEVGGYTRRHAGKVIGAGDDGMAFDTPLNAIFDAVQSRLRGSMEGFEALVERLHNASTVGFQRGLALETLVQRLRASHFQMTDGEATRVLNQLHHEESNVFGLIQAVTRVAQDLESYDRSTEFEAMGGQILSLRPKAWEELVAA